MKFEKWVEIIRKEWEKEWREEKAECVANIHNALVDALAAEKGHIDEIIIALEILLQEMISEKKSQIDTQSRIAVETLPSEIKSHVSK
jgi:predicted RNA-binding protein with EMAP domain